ncbi:MAG: 4,5-DOPA dioxygenase extradiol [Flavobacteriales bacterium]|nr:4,5-DOPA dioxygenase extradiol [Flavobacteriales bacterium]
MNPLNSLRSFTATFSSTEKMPVLFLGHGSPMNAIEENDFVQNFRKLGRELPQPNAILCISAHWYTKGTMVTAMEQPRTIHDFGGFLQTLFDVQYPAPGSPELAVQTQRLLGKHVGLDQDWGLDHGTWSVVKHLYPNADVPVIQLSIDYTKPPEYHFQLASKLQSLREKGVLIIGSGNIVHNLRMVDWPNINKENHGYDWAMEARTSINSHILDDDFKPLLDYRDQGKAYQLAIPTPDHFLPLIYTLGLKGKSEDLELFNDKLMAGSLSMTSVKIG